MVILENLGNSLATEGVLGLGLMTGTSMDGLDLALCRFFFKDQRWSFSLEASQTVPFDETWKARLMHLRAQDAETYARTHVYFGHWLGQQAASFISQSGKKPAFVASHGQTIFHQPERNFTAQIGDGETMAAVLDCLVVSNFRNKDVALGGQGAPLIPLGEQLLFPEYPYFLNLGGFANLSGEGKAFDVAPCNVVLNLLVSQINPEMAWDAEGAMARSGELLPALLERLDQLSFYQKKPPKSLGWEWVEAEILPLLLSSEEAPKNLLHTFCHHIARQIGRALPNDSEKNKEMLITGGGRHNTFLMELISAELDGKGMTLASPKTPEWTDFKEAIVFAFLGLQVLLGQPTTLAAATGAPFNVVGGSIHLPPGSGKKLS